MADSTYTLLTPLQESYIQTYKANNLDFMEACRAVGVAKETVFRWAFKDTQFRNACPYIIETIRDWMDERLMEGVMRGDVKSMILYLQLSGRFVEEVPAA